MSKKRDFSKMTKLERQALAERIFIEYPRLTKLLEKINHCHQYSKIAAEPECMFISGCAGTGKTTLYEYYERQYPRTINESGSNIPVLSVVVPQRASEKTIVSEILARAGDPAAEKGTAYSQTSRLKIFISDCGVEIVFLDEFQHFVDRDSEKILKNVSGWLKNLINATRRPIILFAQPYAEQVLDVTGNEQLQRRFLLRETLEPFGWMNEGEPDTKKKGDEKNEFRAFLAAVDDQLPFNKRSDLSDPIMAFRFYCGTNGRVSKVMTVIRKATELALDRSLEAFDLDVLAEAYEERLGKTQTDRPNPFCYDYKKLEIIPFKEDIPQFLKKREMKKEERASDVLTKKRS
jgi:Bacterial TniB protein